MGRLWAYAWANHRYGIEFPWGTLTVNVVGSLVIGFLAAFTLPEARWVLPAKFNQFFMVGVCGGFTTFSSFSVQTLDLMQKGNWLYALANMIASVVLCLVAVVLGYYAGHWLNR